MPTMIQPTHLETTLQLSAKQAQWLLAQWLDVPEAQITAKQYDNQVLALYSEMPKKMSLDQVMQEVFFGSSKSVQIYQYTGTNAIAITISVGSGQYSRRAVPSAMLERLQALLMALPA